MKGRIKEERCAEKEENKERKQRCKFYKPLAQQKCTNRWWLIVIFALILLLVFGTGVIFGINAYVKSRSEKRILTEEEVSGLQDADCILVLGCLVKNSGEPSHMLEDRLKRAVELYHAGVAPKLLMSGDHGKKDYNEVEAMKQYAIEHGVPSEDVFMDHAGFSTYESCYRAKEVFAAEKIIIVTQEYHLYRAMYVADKLGLETYGINADYRTYYNQKMRDAREVLARVKDFFYALFHPEPTYLGEEIPISGNGDITND